MSTELQIELPERVWMPDEAIRVELTVVHRGAEPVVIAMLGAGVEVDVSLWAPGAESPSTFACPLLPTLVALGDGDRLELEPGDEISVWLELPRASVRMPGEYAMSCSLEGLGVPQCSEVVRFVVDEVARVQVVLSRGRGDLGARGWPCYEVLHGEHATAIMRASLGWNEDWAARSMAAGERERIATLPPGISPVRTMATRTGNGDWIAWATLAGGAQLHAASTRAGFDAGCVALPDGLTRVLRDVLPRDEDGCDVAVLGRGFARVGMFRFVSTPVHDDESSTSTSGSGLWSIALPSASEVVTVARGVGEHGARTAIALAVDSSDGVVLHYGVGEADAPPTSFAAVVVPDTVLVADTTLAVAIDRRGNGHVAMLAATRPPAAAQLVLARIAFGPRGLPHLDHSAIVRDVAALPAPAVAATTSFFIDDDTSQWQLDWAALLDDGRIIGSSRVREPQVIAPVDAPSLPLELLSFASHAILAAHDAGGARRFVELG